MSTLTEIQHQLESMSVPELETLLQDARRRMTVLRRQGLKIREAMARQARQAGLSEAEAEILFGSRK